MSAARDLAWMEMAYGLAEKARGRTSPNPLVGAVVVRDGTVVGHGYHEEPGKAPRRDPRPRPWPAAGPRGRRST